MALNENWINELTINSKVGNVSIQNKEVKAQITLEKIKRINLELDAETEKQVEAFTEDLIEIFNKFSESAAKAISEKGIPERIYCGKRIYNEMKELLHFGIPVKEAEILDDYQVIFDWNKEVKN